jgi:hypothetical protein
MKVKLCLYKVQNSQLNVKFDLDNIGKNLTCVIPINHVFVQEI